MIRSKSHLLMPKWFQGWYLHGCLICQALILDGHGSRASLFLFSFFYNTQNYGAFLFSRVLDRKTLPRLLNPKTHSGSLNSIETMTQTELDRLSIGTVSALKSTLAFFGPNTSGNSENDFGPGFYTTQSLSHSLAYLRNGVGAIVVFKDPALARSSVWQPNLQEWKAWVSRWLVQPFKIAHQEEAPPQ